MTLLAMTDYYANLIRAVNRRYESMFLPPFSVVIVPTAFVFITTPEGSLWTESNRVGNEAKAESALRAFNTFAAQSKQQLSFDHAALMTGYDLVSDDLSSDLLGVAFTFGVCSTDCSSLNEESFSEQTANTLAHEIGHSLGSTHDGNRNPCRSNDFFIMAPSSALPITPDKGGNPWIFSPCSINVIRSFLSSSDAACTLANQAPRSVDIQPFLTQEYGQRVQADQQCRVRYGPTSRFCREDYFVNSNLLFSDLCYNLKCFNPSTGTCILIPAHDGTSCGNRKWCMKGICAVSEMAPARLDTCPQFDDPQFGCTPLSCSNPLSILIYCCGTCNQVPGTTPIPSQPFPSMPASPIPSVIPSFPPSFPFPPSIPPSFPFPPSLPPSFPFPPSVFPSSSPSFPPSLPPSLFPSPIQQPEFN